MFVVALGGGIAVGLSAFLSRGDDSLRAIPADAQMTVTFDLEALTQGDPMERLFRAFAEPLAAAGYIEDPEMDIVGLVDETLETELGLTFEDDVAPWIGGSASIGVWAPDDTDSQPDFLLSLLVQDRAGAETFVETAFADAAGTEVESSSFEGGTMYSTTGEEQGQLWVGDDLLLVAADPETIPAGLEAWSADSIRDTDEYQQLVEDLPGGRIVELYTSSRFIETMNQSMGVGPSITGGLAG
ncbi:MAG TPA: DUF3352 domain-containing protein, partial [Acidimicrobiia bacterium]|nr:DUF3352 domain-containing protein [Acidimicrobiia bacterium]